MVISESELRRLIQSPAGPVFRFLRQRAALVEADAKRRCPKDTSRLASSIHTELLLIDGSPVARVGSSVKYARYVEEGTGIYGPRHRPITPKRASVLRWIPKGASKPAFARSVRGMRPRPYLVPALAAAGGRRRR